MYAPQRNTAAATVVDDPVQRRSPDTTQSSDDARAWPAKRRAGGVDRALAALTYVGVLPFLIIASQPGPLFIRRHMRLAAWVHIVRILWTGAVVAVWWLRFADGPQAARVSSLTKDLAAICLLGTPLPSTYDSAVLPWILTPLIMTWSLSLLGITLALCGRTADFYAFSHADWSDPVPRRRFLYRSAEEERRQARQARERQLERLQKSSQTMRTERSRRDRISALEEQIDRLQVQRDYFDQLLSLGEISQRRYESANLEVDDQAAALRARLSELTTRVAITATPAPASMRLHRLSRPEETAVETIAIITPDGVPIFTYGQFQLDEAIVAGILSAFDSLSEEVFGSRVHKTSLAGGQVLFFAHGQHVLVMAVFDDEPAPRQIEQLRTMLLQFEQANSGPLTRKQYDPSYLHQVEIPFRFAERMPRSE